MPAVPQRFWRFAFFACAVVVLVLALIPIDQPVPTTGWDKTDHVVAFVALTLLGAQSFFKRLSILAASLLAYGVGIEVLQSFTTYRFGEWRDVAADAMGIGLAMLLVRVATRAKTERAAS